MSTYLNIQDAVIKEPAARSWALSCCIASCILSTLTVFILLGNRFALPIPKINDVDIGADRTGEFELTLITNNKNDYLCSADFVYNDVNTHGDIYAFACAQVTSSGKLCPFILFPNISDDLILVKLLKNLFLRSHNVEYIQKMTQQREQKWIWNVYRDSH